MKSKFLLSVVLAFIVLVPVFSISLGEGKPASEKGQILSEIKGLSQINPAKCSVQGKDVPIYLFHLNDVLETILDLFDKDIDKVRTSIDTLRVLAKENAGKYPCLYAVVAQFLDAISKNDQDYDSYTRGLALRALVTIAREAGPEMGQYALESVLDTMASDDLDVVRASAVVSLIELGSTRVLGCLEYAYKNDTSWIVNEMAYRALVILTNGAYESGTMRAGALAQPAGGVIALFPSNYRYDRKASVASLSGRGEGQCLTDEMYEWIKTHTIILDTRIKLEELKCNVQER